MDEASPDNNAVCSDTSPASLVVLETGMAWRLRELQKVVSSLSAPAMLLSLGGRMLAFSPGLLQWYGAMVPTHVRRLIPATTDYQHMLALWGRSAHWQGHCPLLCADGRLSDYALQCQCLAVTDDGDVLLLQWPAGTGQHYGKQRLPASRPVEARQTELNTCAPSANGLDTDMAVVTTNGACLLSRTAFLQQLQSLSAHVPLQHWSLLSLDIARFHALNESLGFASGDRLLVLLGERLQQLAATGAAIARLHADQFALLLPGRHDYADCARQLAEVVAEPFVLSGHTVRISLHFGLITVDPHSSDGEAFLHAADALRYQHKRSSSERRQATEAVALVRGEFSLEQAMREALALAEFYVVYQPKRRANGGALCGFEALLRWDSHQLGMVKPDVFIPLAERIGLISVLGKCVLRDVCRQLTNWRAAGLQPVPVAINVSPHQFADPDFVDTVLATLHDYDLPGDLLEIEITETALIADVGAIALSLQRLQRHGVSIAIDDFGTGYTSLNHLRHLKLNAIKIDRSFVADLFADTCAEELIRVIVEFGRIFGLRLIAEGVETEAQEVWLRAINVTELQGWRTGRPLTALDASALLTSATALSAVFEEA